MTDISYYSEDAIRSRMSCHEVMAYERSMEYGIIRIHYRIDISRTTAILAGLTVIPGLVYVADQVFNDGRLFTREGTHYFDANSGKEISQNDAMERKSKNRDTAKIKWAEDLSKQGNDLWEQKKYSEAAKKYREAYNECTNDRKDLKKLYLSNEGNCFRMQGDYSRAIEFFDKALAIDSNFDHAKNNLAETFNSLGEILFKQGDYAGALVKFNQAYEKCTTSYKNKKNYAQNANECQCELDAIGLKEEGDKDYSEGIYESAMRKYQEAYDKSEVISQREQCKKRIELIQARIHHEDGCQLMLEGDGEADVDVKIMKYKHAVLKFEMALSVCAQSEDSRLRMCVALSAIGDVVFSEGKYREALENYTLAYEKSKEEGTLNQDNVLKAQTELEALILCQRGDELTNEGRYSEALVQYEAAHAKSRMSKMKDKYWSRLSEAKSELEAMRLISLGDELFANWQYEAALEEYETACKTSQISKEKSLHAMNKEKAESIINILSTVEDLWKAGWDIENDVEENDRSEEAKETFERVLCKVREGLMICPNDPSLKQYEKLVLLKEEGNELFNKGLEYQMRGLELMSDSKELREKQNFELANVKFDSAKDKFSKAIEKFQIGSETDARFSDCMEFVQKQINNVDHSIKIIKQEVLNQKFIDLKMNFSERRHRGDDNSELSEKGGHVTYHAQI